MNQIKQTEHFSKWLKGLKDYTAKAAVLKRIQRMRSGLFGDHKHLGSGLFELRIDVGKGWRVYYCRRGETVYLLISGGNKSGQQADIDAARMMLETLGADDE